MVASKPHSLVWALLAASISAFGPVLAAPASFQQAVAEYNGGKYMAAVTDLEAYKNAYPNNTLVRYYLALSHQALNHLDSARAEYQYVAQHGDANLQSMSRAALAAISRVSSSSSSSSSLASMPHSTQTISSNSSSSSPVQKVLEFSIEH